MTLPAMTGGPAMMVGPGMTMPPPTWVSAVVLLAAFLLWLGALKLLQHFENELVGDFRHQRSYASSIS